MAGTLSVSHIQGLATHSSPTTVSIASGHKLHAPGHILQVVHNNTIVQVTTNSTSYTSTTLSGTITPKFSNSKILVNAFIHCKLRGDHDHGMGFKITRAISGGATSDAWTGAVSYEEYMYASDGGTGSGTFDIRGRRPISFLDTPSTTSACTYLVYYRSYRTDVNNAPIVQSDGTESMITLQEVAA